MILFRRIRAELVFGVATLLMIGAAEAQQSAYCDRLRTELSAVEYSLANNANADAAATLKKTQRELDRTIVYAKSIGCNDLRIPLLSAPPPAQCPALEGQITQLQSDLAALNQEAQRTGNNGLEQRRLDLKSGLDANCNPNGTSKNAKNGPQKGLFESLFGAPATSFEAPEMPDDPLGQQPLSLSNGYRTICVRSCDGYFFPISQIGSNSRIGTDSDVCHASCPGAQVRLYLQPADREVDAAVSAEGNEPYTALPTAFKYRTALDSTCACRVTGKSWVDTLADAERILSVSGQGDAQISELKAQELSRPRELKVAKGGKPTTGSPTAQDTALLAALQSQLPPSADIVPLGQGETREITAPDGTKRKIRILRAPGAAPVTGGN